MNRINTLFLFTLLAAVGLTACSGLPQGTVCTVNCTVSGNATLSVTLQSKPLTPPPSTNLLSYNLTVGGATRVLGPGEAYYFASQLPHRFRNVGREACEIISACTPPTF